MCSMCSDYVASCWVCTREKKNWYREGYTTLPLAFYIDTGSNGKFCEHFIERYKTDSPSMYDHIAREHSQEDANGKEYWVYYCDDLCDEEGWYSGNQIVAVVDAFNEWGEKY